MPDENDEVKESDASERKGKPWFFIGIIGGIIVGAMFDNVGAGLAIGISVWLLSGLFEKQ